MCESSVVRHDWPCPFVIAWSTLHQHRTSLRSKSLGLDAVNLRSARKLGGVILGNGGSSIRNRGDLVNGLGVIDERLGVGCSAWKVTARGGWERLVLWSSREVLLGELTLGLVLVGVQVGRVGGSRASSLVLTLTNQILSLGRVLTGGALGNFGSAVGVVDSKVADLSGLLVDNLTGVAKVLINDSLVLDVDEGKEVDKRGGDQSKAPGWDDLD